MVRTTTVLFSLLESMAPCQATIRDSQWRSPRGLTSSVSISIVAFFVERQKSVLSIYQISLFPVLCCIDFRVCYKTIFIDHKYVDANLWGNIQFYGFHRVMRMNTVAWNTNLTVYLFVENKRLLFWKILMKCVLLNWKITTDLCLFCWFCRIILFAPVA